MVEEGWYTDPFDSTRLRYWQGDEWTEHTQDRPPETESSEPEPPPAEPVAPEPSQQPRLDPPPPPPPPQPRPDPPPQPLSNQPDPPPAPPVQPDYEPPFSAPPAPDPAWHAAHPGQLGDMGTWLKATFKAGMSKLVPCGFLALLGFVPAIFFYALVFLGLSDVSADPNGEIGGGAIAVFFLSAVLFIVWMLWAGVIALAQNHLLHETHLGKPTSIGDSVQVGLQGVGRLVWAYLTVLIYVIVVFLFVGGLIFVLGLVSEALATWFFVIAYLAVLVLSIWLGVKLAFVLVASAVAPRGESVIAVSVDTAEGHFWTILGRMVVLGLIMSAVMVPVVVVFAVLFAALGTSFLNDAGSATATAAIGSVVIGFVVYLVAALAMQVFSYSGLTRLYIELDGPVGSPSSAV